MRRTLFGLLLAISLIAEADARGQSVYHFSPGRVYYGGGRHTYSHGGHYAGGSGSSLGGGHYQNHRTGHHYGRHK
jgi:hypothetical protein